MKQRRWEAGRRYDLSGLRLRTMPGEKFPGDIRLDVWTGQGWRAVEMALGFFLVDFFTENEQERKAFMDGWRFNGDVYYLDRCYAAVRDGWIIEAERIKRQRLK